MHDAHSPQAKPDPNAAVSFAQMLREELTEITKLRKKRQWEHDRDTGEIRAVDATCQPSLKNTLPEEQSVPVGSRHVSERDSDTERSTDEIFKEAHKMSLVGLAFSGGGIRSATFNLGVLQGLAELRLLPMFDYVST